jgi:hypothetical protein
MIPKDEASLNDRSYLEKWLDKHNHKLELIRTVTSFMAMILSAIVLTQVV